MATTKGIPTELLEQLRRDRERIAAELPELMERGRLLDEAAAENSLCGRLRRAIHQSGRPLKRIATEVGLDVFVLCDFLEGTRTLRSDVLDRLDQAVRDVVQVESAPPKSNVPDAGKKARKSRPTTRATKGRKRDT
jgi:hypothetical protein